MSVGFCAWSRVYGICFVISSTIKPVLSSLSKEDQKLIFKTDYYLMQAGLTYYRMLQGTNEGQKNCRMLQNHSAILLIFIKRRSVFKTLGLSVCESPRKSGFTVFIVLRKRDSVGTFNCIITYL